MAVFLLKLSQGSSYAPPACAGIFSDVPCTPGAGFSDWIEVTLQPRHHGRLPGSGRSA